MLRIKKAKELIQSNPNIKIKELTGMVGFNNVISFNRIFKKYENMSPGQYRLGKIELD